MKNMISIFKTKTAMIKLKYFVITTLTIVLSLACQKEEAETLQSLIKVILRQMKPKLRNWLALNLKAYTEEEKVTRRLQDLTKAYQAKLQGLEHRLKTKSSTLRKLKKMHHDAPN